MLWVLDAEAGDGAADDHQDAGDADAEVEGRGRGIGGGCADPGRLGRRQLAGFGNSQRLGLGVGDDLLGAGTERTIAEIAVAERPRRAFSAMSASSKNPLRLCAQQKAGVAGDALRAGSKRALNPL